MYYSSLLGEKKRNIFFIMRYAIVHTFRTETSFEPFRDVLLTEAGARDRFHMIQVSSRNVRAKSYPSRCGKAIENKMYSIHSTIGWKYFATERKLLRQENS